MLAMMLMAAQAIAEPPAPVRTIGPILPPAARAVTPCPPPDAAGGDITVCGKVDSARYRLQSLGPPPNCEPPPPMTMRVGKDGTLDGRAVQHCAGPVCTPAAMATLKLKF